jgi:hypothetical protein
MESKVLFKGPLDEMRKHELEIIAKVRETKAEEEDGEG